MTRRDEPTHPHTPSSIQRIALWGIVEAWLAESPQRAVMLDVGPRGLRMTVIDPDLGEVIENISLAEDPSRAALRGVQKLRDGSR